MRKAYPMRIQYTTRTRSRSGLSLIEVLVVMALLAVALTAMADTVLTVTRLGPINAETGRALDAARGMIETIRACPFDEVFVRFNAGGADDPDGPGTALGRHFSAPMLATRPGDADGFVGRVILPESGAALREDIADPLLGMPRDLNGDSWIDGTDHRANYDILPISVIVEWSARNGDRQLTLCTELVRP